MKQLQNRYHQYRDSAGRWHGTRLPVPLNAFGRSRLVFDRHDNAHVVMPRGRILTASRASGWTDWTPRFDARELGAFGEVLVDSVRITTYGTFSVMYQQRSSGTTPSPIRVADFRIAPRQQG
ncbi:hypothetical protein FHX42_001081 [Saccharopolyspora lacisalsi]|uniref:Uncharacterized protein n=1 Tax=Halosaccharopolyspora lacisalsi TaxID=1000566 RepID=A0A839DP42_9PSEU|nr:hypothetical protein [Halosaccharopolyspora lacisalsi]MBA8823752.1 hypothetical protein [Halosaccharopolyspora lacisalsi]